MRFIRPEQLAHLRSIYPPGTRVMLIRMDDVQAPPIGTQGTVTGVDDKEVDGNVKFEVQLKLDYTKDKRYKSLPTYSLAFENIDDDASMASIVSNAIFKKSQVTLLVQYCSDN